MQVLLLLVERQQLGGLLLGPLLVQQRRGQVGVAGEVGVEGRPCQPPAVGRPRRRRQLLGPQGRPRATLLRPPPITNYRSQITDCRFHRR